MSIMRFEVILNRIGGSFNSDGNIMASRSAMAEALSTSGENIYNIKDPSF